jgi:hypothetical protein
MKVIVEVKEALDSERKCYSTMDGNIWLLKKYCEPVQEGWITEEQFKELFNRCHGWADYNYCLKYAKELGWIKPSKTAKQKFEELAIKPILIEGGVIDSVTKYIQEIVDAAKDAISEAEKK